MTDSKLIEGERSVPRKYCRPCGDHTAVSDSQGVWSCPSPEHPAVPGDVQKTIARGDNYKGQPFTAPYLTARIYAVHSYGCPATRNGKRSGPCDCGGRDLMAAFLATHADAPWAGVEQHPTVARTGPTSGGA